MPCCAERMRLAQDTSCHPEGASARCEDLTTQPWSLVVFDDRQPVTCAGLAPAGCPGQAVGPADLVAGKLTLTVLAGVTAYLKAPCPGRQMVDGATASMAWTCCDPPR